LNDFLKFVWTGQALKSVKTKTSSTRLESPRSKQASQNHPSTFCYVFS